MQRQGATHCAINREITIRSDFTDEFKALTNDRRLQIAISWLGAAISAI
jgi:hypothetical protein